MKCTHCNGEHPDGYRFCPLTGKEIVLPFKACTNPECVDFDKHVLPPESLFCPICGQRIGQIDTKAEDYSDDFEDLHVKIYDDGMYCPVCGSNDVWRYFGEDDRYVCRDCEQSWEGTMESQYADGVIMKFMPIDGVTLGRTTADDAEYMFDEDDIDKDDDGSISVCTDRDGNFYKDSGSYFFDQYGLDYPKPIPCILEANGFGWEYEPDYYTQLFKSLGFDVFKSERTHVMHLSAFSSDGSIRFVLRFGAAYYPKRTKVELSEISMYSNPYENADARKSAEKYNEEKI